MKNITLQIPGPNSLNFNFQNKNINSRRGFFSMIFCFLNVILIDYPARKR
jgi:hypothetical protein